MQNVMASHYNRDKLGVKQMPAESVERLRRLVSDG